MKLNGKRIDHQQLRTELQAAGISLPGFFEANDELWTYDGAGAPTDLPPEAAAVVAAHVPAPPPPPPDYGADASRADQIADAVTNLRAYLAASSPTAAQTVAALKLVIRAVLFLLRRAL